MGLALAQTICDTCQPLPKKFLTPVDTCPTVFWMCNAMALVRLSGMCGCVCVRACVCVLGLLRSTIRRVRQAREQGCSVSEPCPQSRTALCHSLPTDRKTSRAAQLLRSFLSPLYLLCSCLQFSSCVCMCVCLSVAVCVCHVPLSHRCLVCIYLIPLMAAGGCIKTSIPRRPIKRRKPVGPILSSQGLGGGSLM